MKFVDEMIFKTTLFHFLESTQCHIKNFDEGGEFLAVLNIYGNLIQYHNLGFVQLVIIHVCTRGR